MKTRILVIVCLALCVLSCSKIRDGFLSDTLHYRDRVINCKRGMTLSQSERIDADGSTPPFKFKMVNLRDKNTGEPAPEAFFTEFDVPVFKDGMSFNPETDTTLELVNAKREVVKMTPMTFNESSGQVSFNKASINLPYGEYIFDIEATNSWGVKFYENIAEIHVVDPANTDFYELKAIQDNASDASETFTLIQAPRFSVKKIADTGARAILKIVDKNGVAFNPKAGEIIKRGDRPNFETYAKFHPVIMTDTAMICDFELAPFPLANYIDNTGYDWTWYHYYRIPSQFCIVDNLGRQALNPAFNYQLKMEGTYVVEVKIMDVVRSPIAATQ